MAYRQNAKPEDRPPSFLVRVWHAYVNRYLANAGLISLAVAVVLLFLGFGVARSPSKFNHQYVQPIQGAILATDPEIALLNLERAIRYAEANGFADGNTAQPPRPEGDLLAWHRTLIAAAADVAVLTPATPIEERRRVLTRVRAKLATSAYEPRLPEDIDAYPRHRLQKAAFRGSLVFLVAAIVQCILGFRMSAKAASQS